MKVLIVTQSVDINNPVLGFFVGWIREFAKKFEFVTVICLEKGEYDLPENVKILSLGKENGRSKIKYIYNFYKYIFQEIRNYNVVFVHMNQEYIILGGLFWRFFNKKVFMWRNHFAGSCITSLASKISNKVYFTSPHSFTARFKNSIQMPVGIDTNVFSPKKEEMVINNSILFVGRLSAVKRPNFLLEAEKILLDMGINITASFYGEPGESDRGFYKKMLEDSIDFPHNIYFRGAVKNIDLPAIYSRHQVLVNLSPDGMLDKGIFESLSCGTLVLTSNSVMENVLPKDLIFYGKSAEELAVSLKNVLSNRDIVLKNDFRSFVINNHSLDLLVVNFVNDVKNLSNYKQTI